MSQLNERNRKNPLWITLALLVLTICGIVYYFVYPAYLAMPLRGMNIPHIFVGEQEYQISEGKPKNIDGKKVAGIKTKKQVILLALYYKFFLEQPLVGDRDLDVESLLEALDEIENYQSKIINHESLSSEIIPTTFLRNFAKSSQLAKTLGERIDIENVNKYNQELIETVNQYEKALDEKLALINLLSEGQKSTTFRSFKIGTNATIAIDDLKLMKKNAVALRRELEYRDKLSDGRAFPRIKPASVTPTELTGVSFDDVWKVDDLYIPEKYQNLASGPYITESSCTDGTYSEKPFYIYYASKHGANEYLVSKLANNNLFTKIDPVIDAENNFAIQGYDWEPVSDGFSYKCQNDNEYQQELLNIDQFLRQFPLPILDGDENSLVAEQERLFYEQKYYSTKNLNILGDNYKIVYDTMLTDGRLEESAKVLERYLFIRNKTNNIDKLFNSTMWLNVYYYLTKDMAVKTENKSLNDFHTEIIRANYAISFLNNSQLFWVLDEKPKYSLPITETSNEEVFLDQAGLLKILDIDTIKKMLTIEAKDDLIIN